MNATQQVTITRVRRRQIGPLRRDVDAVKNSNREAFTGPHMRMPSPDGPGPTFPDIDEEEKK